MKTICHSYINNCLVSVLLSLMACSDFVEVDPPRTDLMRSTVFGSSETANAAVLDIYFQMSSSGFASGDINSITLLAALSADEIVNGIKFDPSYKQFNDNVILPSNIRLLRLWTDMYNCIYKANAIIEGLSDSAIDEPTRTRLIGEARFARALCYFYLVNLFGDVPMVISTDYKENQNISRLSADQVYLQILSDAKAAQEALPNDFSASNDERIRGNKGAATALLSRIYLFTGDWAGAEMQATKVIEDPLYELSTLNGVFLKNSSEVILQLPPRFGTVPERSTFRSYNMAITSRLVSAFEAGDARKTAWLQLAPAGYYRPNKYQSGDGSSSEYSVVIRLAEVYLIRSEARIRQHNLSGALDDLNAIRLRAGLNTATVKTLSLAHSNMSAQLNYLPSGVTDGSTSSVQVASIRFWNLLSQIGNLTTRSTRSRQTNSKMTLPC